MRLLLDTHIWLWSLGEPSRLAPRVTQALEAKDTELWLSPISLWELGILVEKGKVDLRDSLDAWIDDALRITPMREAPLTRMVVRALGSITTPHRDPADRFLAATAAALDLQLVTSDEQLLAGRGYRVLPNR
jgi:PIN domain nuclease of toxin-antitoxin system